MIFIDSPEMVNVYITNWKDPSFSSWVNQLSMDHFTGCFQRWCKHPMIFFGFQHVSFTIQGEAGFRWPIHRFMVIHGDYYYYWGVLVSLSFIIILF